MGNMTAQIIEKPTVYHLKVSPKTKELVLQYHLMKNEVKDISAEGDYVQSGKGKNVYQTFSLTKDRNVYFSFFRISENADTSIQIQVQKKRGDQWSIIKKGTIKEDEGQYIFDEYLKKGEYRVVTRASKKDFITIRCFRDEQDKQ